MVQSLQNKVYGIRRVIFYMSYNPSYMWLVVVTLRKYYYLILQWTNT
jgi:hypothetical protein